MYNLFNYFQKLKVLDLFKPSVFVCLIYFVYFLPILFISLSDGIFLASLYPTKLSHSWLVFFLFFVNFIVLYITSKFKIYAFSHVPSLNFPRWVSLWVMFFFSLLCIFSIIILDDKLNIYRLFSQLLNDQIAYFLNQPKVGAELASSGMLKFFFISQMSFVLIYFALILYKDSIFVKVSSIFFVVLLLVFFFLISRREVIIYFFFLSLLGFLTKKNCFTAFKYIIPVLLMLIVTVNIRTASDNLLDISAFLKSQEFYPFQFGAVLIDRWISDFYLEDISYLIPFSIFYTDFEFSTLSQKLMSDVFLHVDPGPTVSINYTLIGFLYFPVIIYFSAICVIMNYIYHQCLLSKRGYVYIPYYSFLCIKLLLFIRNGEVINHFIDCFIFTVLYLPFFIFLPRVEDEKQIV